MTARRSHFGPKHHLADVAANHCRHVGPLLGDVACGACWELAIRDDERFAVEMDLPRDVTPDLAYVDEIAVELACGGERVALTPAEFRQAVNILARRRMFPVQIARRLHTTYARVKGVLDGTAAPARHLAAVA